MALLVDNEVKKPNTLPTVTLPSLRAASEREALGGGLYGCYVYAA